MSTSTDGQISYGIVFPEGFEFPWNKEEEYEGDLEYWWRDISGYEPPFLIDWEHRNRADTEENARVSEYFAHQRAWDEAHPTPVEIVNYCYIDSPMYILAVPGTVTTASRGYPVAVPRLVRNGASEVLYFEFIEQYIKPPVDDDKEQPDEAKEIDWEPEWWLSSYWG